MLKTHEIYEEFQFFWDSLDREAEPKPKFLCKLEFKKFLWDCDQK